ncbi:MAG TPA: hemerythrin domain-containing protein [Kofleriaceae bacterium]|nr:hemerythrin domain-containing protein [Kofleriaceae bacterium]
MSRRRFLTTSTATAALASCAGKGGATTPAAGGEAEDEVTPAEDLMREHGVLRRVLFVFDEAAHRLDTGADLPLDQLAAGAGIIRRVIEDYHEKLEEDHLFPRFEKAGKLVDLVAVLRAQHKAGREVTAQVLALSAGKLGDPERPRLAALLRSFNRMYRPHAAREDTVLFPALHQLVGGKAYDELGEQFEDIEKQTLGEGGFERSVVEVARIEQAFGLDDLAKLTP